MASRTIWSTSSVLITDTALAENEPLVKEMVIKDTMEMERAYNLKAYITQTSSHLESLRKKETICRKYYNNLTTRYVSYHMTASGNQKHHHYHHVHKTKTLVLYIIYLYGRPVKSAQKKSDPAPPIFLLSNSFVTGTFYSLSLHSPDSLFCSPQLYNLGLYIHYNPGISEQYEGLSFTFLSPL